MSSIEYRHPVEEDIEDIVRTLNESNREHPFFTETTVREWRSFLWDDSDYDPKGYLVAIIDHEIVGYGGTMISKSRLEHGYNDAYIGLDIIPEHRGKGIEQHLVNSAMDFLRSNNIAKAGCGSFGTEGWKHDIAKEFGFKDVRHFYIMKWKEKNPPETIATPQPITYTTVMMKEASDEEILKFAHGLNKSFADHWNHSPVTDERALRWRGIEDNKIRLCYAMDREDLAGICMADERVTYNKENGTKDGWANLLGVMPEYRRNGLGRALLSDGMRWIYEQGMDTIYLGVDAENEKALDLYKSLDFKVYKESIHYQRDM